jgi:hypothetical protein
LGYGLVFSENFGFWLGLGFSAPVWVRFLFLFFKKPGFRLGFGFFQNFNKFMGISRKISMKKKRKQNEFNQFIEFTVWIQYMAGFQIRKKVLRDVTRYTK